MQHLHARLDEVAHRIAWLPPLLIRIVLGVTFLLAGWGKLHGLADVTHYFGSLGIPAPGVMAPFVAGVELVGGALVLAGLATRVAALLLAATMVVAIATAIWPKVDGIGELLGTVEAIYLASLSYLAIQGAGAISLDRLARQYLPVLQSQPPQV